jgi:hypothetical protein
MSEYSLVYPMLAMVLMTFGVSVILFQARVRAVRQQQIPASYFRILQGSPEPESVAKPTRHLINLFETPVLFYAGCLAAMVAGVGDAVALGLAWAYVCARIWHAWVHLGENRVRVRIRAFAAGWFCLLALWIYLGVAVAIRS